MKTRDGGRQGEVHSAHRREVPPRYARRTCGICDGELRRGTIGYHKWRGEQTVCVLWTCQHCETSGNILRDPKTGSVLRLGHVITGNGFEVVGEDDLSAVPEGWRVVD